MPTAAPHEPPHPPASRLQRLRQRKVAQWAGAYAAAAWLILQLLDLLADRYAWPDRVFDLGAAFLAVGFLGAIVIAWFHGERGEQRVSTIEILMLTGILVIAGAAVAFVGGGLRASAKAEDAEVLDRSSLAVLPFVNMSGDAENEYFSDGITEEILNGLAQVPGLRVAARTSSFTFKGRNVPVDEIGERLHVGVILEGSVRKARDSVRITAQLVSARDGYHLWSQSYNRRVEDVFGIQEEIARSIVRALEVKLVGDSSRVVRQGTHDLDAYNLVLRGRYMALRFTEPALRSALKLYDQALERDPGFARAWVDAAYAWMMLADDWITPREGYGKAREAVLRAFAIDSTLAEAHEVMGLIHLTYTRDLAAAEREVRYALEANPNLAYAHLDMADLLGLQGKEREAVAQLNTAIRVDPLSIDNIAWGSRLYLELRRYDDAIATARMALEQDPQHLLAHSILGDALLASGKAPEALAAYRDGLTHDPTYVRLRGGEARALAALGRRGEARRILASLEADAADHYVRGEEIAAVAAALGDNDRALRWLQRAADDRSAGIVFVGRRPMYDPLRSDPRFARLLRDNGLGALLR